LDKDSNWLFHTNIPQIDIDCKRGPTHLSEWTF